MSDAENGLAAVERQQANVASRLSVPGWYLACYGLGVAAFLAGQPLRFAYDAGVASFALQLFGALVLCSPAYVLSRVTGVRLFTRLTAAYPSTRRNSRLLVVVLIVGMLGVIATARGSLIPLSFAVSVVGGIAAAVVLRLVYRGISADIVAGNVPR